MVGQKRQSLALDAPEEPVSKEAIRPDIPQWLLDKIREDCREYGVSLDYLGRKISEAAAEAPPEPETETEADPAEDGEITGEDLWGAPVDHLSDLIEPPGAPSDSPTTVEQSPLFPVQLLRAYIQPMEPSIQSPRAPPQSQSCLVTPVTVPVVSPQTPAGHGVGDEYVLMELPEWYTKITTRAINQLTKRPSSSANQTMQALKAMKGCAERCEINSTPKELEDLRQHIHKAEIRLKVDGTILRKERMLEERGLPRIFTSTKVDFPWDLKADAWALYLRWYGEYFDVNLFRGIKTRKQLNRGSDSIDPSYKGRVLPNFVGQGHLMLGQWWPTQLTLVRDGGHGSSQGGIYGEKGKGAYSIVLSGMGSKYGDKDNGDDIWYSGTHGDSENPTENTLRLIESCKEGSGPVRVIRSHQLPKNNPYRPEVGLRYDGLYQVVEKRLVDEETNNYMFHLVRCSGQYPIRSGNGSFKRPTVFEIAEYEKLKKNGRW